MKKKRFQKKQILGFIKSYHAKRRQIEREVTDELLTKVLQQGEVNYRSEYEAVFVFEGYQVYVSKDLEKIITVTSPDKEPPAPKTVSKKDGAAIKEQIQEKQEEIEEEKELTFEEYMKNWKE